MESTADAAVKRIATLVAGLGAFLTPFMSAALNVAQPMIEREFSLDAVSASWVALSFLLAAAMALVPLGKAADIYGRKRVFACGTLIYTSASLLCAAAPSAAWLIGFRVLQGVGGAMIFGTAAAILASVFPAGERGKALGINVAVTYLGLSLGPVLGGVLTQHWGWRSVFLFNAPLGLLAALLVLWKLKGEWAEARGDRFDWFGSLVYGLALVALMVGFSRMPAPLGVWLMLAGVAGLAAFGWWETRTAYPVLSMRLFRRNAAFTFSNLAALINYSATFAVGFILGRYLQYIRALNPQNAGLILVSQSVVMAVFSPLAGRLSDRIAARLLASSGMGVVAVGLTLLAFVSERTPLAFIVLSLMLLGLGFALFSSPNVHAIMSAVGRQDYGVASAMLSTMRLVGQAFSMGIATWIVAVYVGQVQITPETYPQFLASIGPAFAVFAALCLGGVFASLARGERRPEGDPHGHQGL